MRRTILGTFILAVILAAGTLGAVAATNEVADEKQSTGIPSLCEQAYDQATVQVLKRGHSLTQPALPTLVVSNEAGNCEATFDWRGRNSPIEVTLLWDGDEQITVPVDPEYVVKSIGFNYAFVATIKADGSFEFEVPVPTRQVWWCGYGMTKQYPGLEPGECYLTTGDAYFSPACIEASKDLEYLKSHKPGTGPACVAHSYEKLPDGEVVIVD